jgi:hypothetical protein
MPTVIDKESNMAENIAFDTEYAYDRYIQEKLAEAEVYAARPDAKWYTEEEFWAAIKERHGGF